MSHLPSRAKLGSSVELDQPNSQTTHLPPCLIIERFTSPSEAICAPSEGCQEYGETVTVRFY